MFFWLRKVELAKERVKIRVGEGGHNIDEDIIVRRYWRGILNLFDLFLPLVDEAMIFDNSEGLPVLIAEKALNESLSIINEPLFCQLNDQYEAGKQNR